MGCYERDADTFAPRSIRRGRRGGFGKAAELLDAEGGIAAGLRFRPVRSEAGRALNAAKRASDRLAGRRTARAAVDAR
jgi:hypothetical protein